MKSPSNAEIQPAVHVIQETPQNDVVDVSIQESKEESSNSERVSLAYVPSTAVERHIYNNYKLLVLMISNMLLSSEVQQFKEWARNVFDVDLSNYVYEGFLELDRKGVISASNMTNLQKFFTGLQRFDVVHLVDCFLQGDYAYLQQSVSSRKNYNASGSTRTAGLGATPSTANPKRALALGLLGGARNSESSQGDEVEESFTVRRAELQNSQNINRAGMVVTNGVAHKKCGKIKREEMHAEIKL